MNKKTIYIIVAVLVVVIVVGAAGVMLLNGNGGEPTPTPTPAVGVADATSLQFSVEDSSGNYTYAAKNIGTNITLRLEILGADNFVYILNGTEQKAWSNVTGTWAEEQDFNANWDMWIPVWQGYVDNLENWTGTGDYTYTADGTSVKISDISVNPTLADSLFATS